MAVLEIMYFSLMLCLKFAWSTAGQCGGSFTSESGTIQSPGFPRHYTERQRCVYRIEAPRHRRITLHFTEFDLAADNSKCTDFVTVRDGIRRRSPRLGRFCGTEIPRNQRTFGSGMMITFETDRFTNGSRFRATYTTGTYDGSFLLITDEVNEEIYRVDPETMSALSLPVEAAKPKDVSYDPVEGKVYWTESLERYSVNSAFLNGSSKTLVATAKKELGDLAIDHLSRLLFFAEFENRVIGVITLSTKARRTAISSQRYPHSLVLHMALRTLFWCGGYSIERSNYDGSDRRTLFVDKTEDLINRLALDTSKNRLYALQYSGRLVSFNIDGGGKVFEGRISSVPPFGLYLVFFRNALLIAQSGGLVRYSLVDKISTVLTYKPDLVDIYAYDQNSLTADPSGCGTNNGGCSVICAPLPGNSTKCLCPDGEGLSSDNTTCVNATVVVQPSRSLPFLLNGSRELNLTCGLDRSTEFVEDYAWNVLCSERVGRWCVFQPSAADDGKEVTCTVTWASGRTAAGSLVLSFNYPPPAPPFIKGYQSKPPLQVNDTSNMTCEVHGGNPSASAVIFFCQGHPDNNDVIDHNKVSSVLIIKSLMKEDNGSLCTCIALWKGTPYKDNMAAPLTMLVIDAPQDVTPTTESSQAITTQVVTTTKEGDTPLVIGCVGGGLFLLIVIVVSIREVLSCRRRAEKRALRRERQEEHHYSALGLSCTTAGPAVSASNALHVTASGDDDIYHEIDDNYEISSQEGRARIVTGPPPLPTRLPPGARPSAASLSVCAHKNRQAGYLTPCVNPAHDYSQASLVPANPVKNTHHDHGQTRTIQDANSPALPSDYLTPIKNPNHDYGHTRTIGDANSPALPSDYLTPIKNPNHDYGHTRTIGDANSPALPSDYLTPIKNPNHDYGHTRTIGDANSPALPSDYLTPIKNPNHDYGHTRTIGDANSPALPSDYLTPIKNPNHDYGNTRTIGDTNSPALPSDYLTPIKNPNHDYGNTRTIGDTNSPALPSDYLTPIKNPNHDYGNTRTIGDTNSPVSPHTD